MSKKNNNLVTSLVSLIKTSSKDKNISEDVIINALKKAYETIARKKYGMDAVFEAVFDPNESEFLVYQYKTVVEEVKYDTREVSLNEAKELSPEIQLGEDLGVLVNIEIKRNDVGFVKQFLMNQIRQAEKDNLMEEYQNRVGKIVSGTIRNQTTKGDYLVDLGRPEYPAILYKNQVLPTDELYPGAKVSAYLLSVNAGKGGPEVRLSRTTHLYILKMLEDEFPEFQEGSLEVVKIAREAGERTKVVVKSNDPDVDVMRVLLQDNAFRLNQIRDEFFGEKINVIENTLNEEELLMEVIKPGVISNYVIGEETIDLVGPEDDSELGKLIGKRGSNLKLVASIMGKKVNVISRSKLKEKVNEAVKELVQVEGVSEVTAHSLVQKDIFTVVDLAKTSVDELTQILGDDVAENVKSNAEKTVKENTYTPAPEINLVESYSFAKLFNLPKKRRLATNQSQEAEMRLREELKSFNLK